MKSILELNETKVPAVKIDPALNKYDKVVLFPEKLAMANEMLKKTNIANIIGKKLNS
jgi:hypothetical protein